MWAAGVQSVRGSTPRGGPSAAFGDHSERSNNNHLRAETPDLEITLSIKAGDIVTTGWVTEKGRPRRFLVYGLAPEFVMTRSCGKTGRIYLGSMRKGYGFQRKDCTVVGHAADEALAFNRANGGYGF